MLSNQWVNHFIDTFSTNAVVPVVGWLEAIAETRHNHCCHPPMGFAALYPILCGLRLGGGPGNTPFRLRQDSVITRIDEYASEINVHFEKVAARDSRMIVSFESATGGLVPHRKFACLEWHPPVTIVEDLSATAGGVLYEIRRVNSGSTRRHDGAISFVDATYILPILTT